MAETDDNRAPKEMWVYLPVTAAEQGWAKYVRADLADQRVHRQSDGELRDSISFTALIQVLERLRSKNKNPNRKWYEGWNAAIDCLLNDAKARAHAPVVDDRE